MAKVPTWLGDVGPEGQDLVLGLFAELLEESPLSQAELAKELRVSTATVSRWAHKQQDPSLDHMNTALGLVKARLAESGRAAAALDEVLGLVTAAVETGTLQDRVPVLNQLRDLWAQRSGA